MSDEDGVLAIGGELSVNRLLLAYRHGIFPWYSDGQPIIWWYPRPRYIIRVQKLKTPKSLRPYFNQAKYYITIDRQFDQIINLCQNVSRANQSGTWITDDMKQAYINLHHHGFAHSVEVYNKEHELVGGLYGVCVGRIFSGESMFSFSSNASKFGLIAFVQILRKELGIEIIDCQQHSNHMELLGGEYIDEVEYFNILRKNLRNPDAAYNWKSLDQ